MAMPLASVLKSWSLTKTGVLSQVAPAFMNASDQLPLLRVDADGRPALVREAPSRAVDVVELLVSKGTGFAGHLLVIDAQRELQTPEQAPHGLRAHNDAGFAQLDADLQGCLTFHLRPLIGSPAVW